eukprot:6162111-Pyramimonas_sp.AAC.1
MSCVLYPRRAPSARALLGSGARVALLVRAAGHAKGWGVGGLGRGTPVWVRAARLHRLVGILVD